MNNECHKQMNSRKGGFIILTICDALDCLNIYNTPYDWLHVRRNL